MTCHGHPLEDVPENLMPANFIKTSFEQDPNNASFFICPGNGPALMQMGEMFGTWDVPVVLMKEPVISCGENLWQATKSTQTVFTATCVTPPADFNLDSEVRYEYYDSSGEHGTSDIIPLLPEYNYCPDDQQKILADGTPFKSITVGKDINTLYRYNVTLVNGTIARFEQTYLLNVMCAEFCTDIPRVPLPLPNRFIAEGPFQRYMSDTGVAFKCQFGETLTQLHNDGPVVLMLNAVIHCREGRWKADNSDLDPATMTCVTHMGYAEWTRVRYIHRYGHSDIVPLLPDYKYCPPGMDSVLEDGTPFKSIVITKDVNDPDLYYYDVMFSNYTIQRFATKDWFKVACDEFCTDIPPVPLPLPNGFTAAGPFERYMSDTGVAFKCPGNGRALTQLYNDGPIVLMQNAVIHCTDGRWKADNSDLDPATMTCVTPPTGFTDGTRVRYIHRYGHSDIAPLLPDYKYCPEGTDSVLEDGTPFKSIVITKDANDGDLYYYDVKLSNDTIQRFATKDWFKVACDDHYTTTSTTTTTTIKPTTTTTISPNCPPGGIWSEWTFTGTCPTTCGSCSIVTRTRTCEKTCGNCPCTGPSTDSGPCGNSLCSFPAKTCCGSYIKSFSSETGRFYCGYNNETVNPKCLNAPTSTTTVATTTTTISPNCPPGGMWSEWTFTGTCPTTCGSCTMVTRTRTCEQTCGNCPCTGPSTDSGPCGDSLCSFPTKTCCGSYIKSINSETGRFYCGFGNETENPKCLGASSTTTTTTSTTSTTTLATTTTIKPDSPVTSAQLWDVIYYYNYGKGCHAFCADQSCINAIQLNGIGYDMVNGKGLVGKAVSESDIGAVRAACPTGSQNLRNLGFAKSGNTYLHNFFGSGLKQGWVSIAYGSCGAKRAIKRWVSRYSQDMMYDVDLEWNTWYQGLVQDGGRVQFYMWD